MRAVARMIRPLMPDFLGSVTTVLGDVVYTPGDPGRMPRDELAAVLAHELVHQLDQATYGPWFYVSYGVIAPTGRTFRAVWERRAYAVDLMLAHDRAGPKGLERCLDRLIPLFSGPTYGWMWAGDEAARRFLRPTADDIERGVMQTREPYRRILAAWRG